MDFVTLRTIHNYFSAHIMLTRLRDSGIHCFLKDEFTVTTDPILSNALGGIKLVVRSEDAQQVEKLITTFEEEFRKNAVCSQCGGHNITRVARKNPSNIFTILITWLFSSLALSGNDIYECGDCHYQSEQLDEPLGIATIGEDQPLMNN